MFNIHQSEIHVKTNRAKILVKRDKIWIFHEPSPILQVRHAFGASLFRRKRCLRMDLRSHSLVLLGGRWSYRLDHHSHLPVPTLATLDATRCALLVHSSCRIFGPDHSISHFKVYHFCPVIHVVCWKIEVLDFPQFD